MTAWPDQPVIVEINTWVWLDELRRRHGADINLGSVPAGAWDDAVPAGADAVWLMGVWQRSSQGAVVAREHDGVRADVRAALPDATDRDVVGSPYCIRGYTVDPLLGGDDALAQARSTLARRGFRLVLDYVPNHVARDNPWTADHPDYLVTGTPEDLERDPASFAEVAGRIFALGRDPHFPAWTDVVQVNAFGSDLRSAMTEQLR
ncbi:MAG: alpha-amylase, partial [Nitriliruptorales bacterium]|nr:alpha-amylase [Nitriliruptorales bacterium]